ncbi:MAG: hypothetical protein IJG18_13220, partial [Kiritimatiellae bacterium]|nr:hypothetical protein [Kiritimatiellia bacterium]
KKVAFCAAAAAMCGGLLAVESANIVGYINVENDVSGYMQRGGTFITTGGGTDTYDIQSIIPQKPTNAATELEDGGAIIQEIDDYGEVIQTYSYFLKGSTATPAGKAGWYYMDSTLGQNVYADKTFVRGEGFLYQAPYFENAGGDEIGSSFSTSGEVNTNNTKSVYSEVSGYCHRSNFRFSNLSIQKLTPKATAEAATELEDGGAIIQEIDDYGEVIQTYSYFLAGSTATPSGIAGWYYMDSTLGQNVFADKEFVPGEGFLYQAPYFEDDKQEEIGSYLEFGE